jgi:hypothetical protein
MKVTRVLWKCYFFFFVSVSIADIALRLFLTSLHLNWSSFILLEVIPSILGCIGLFGFAYSRRIWSLYVWRTLFVVFVLIQLLAIYDYLGIVQGLEPQARAWDALSESVLPYLTEVPFIVAIYMYAYRSRPIWVSSSAGMMTA